VDFGSLPLALCLPRFLSSLCHRCNYFFIFLFLVFFFHVPIFFVVTTLLIVSLITWLYCRRSKRREREASIPWIEFRSRFLLRTACCGFLVPIERAE
jgi:hypothetical protein